MKAETAMRTVAASDVERVASLGLRRHQRQSRSAVPTGRRRNRPALQKPTQVIGHAAAVYRRAGSRSIAFWTIVSRSRGILGASVLSRTGSSCITFLISS